MNGSCSAAPSMHSLCAELPDRAQCLTVAAVVSTAQARPDSFLLHQPWGGDAQEVHSRDSCVGPRRGSVRPLRPRVALCAA